jgi:hypothetical protein
MKTPEYELIPMSEIDAEARAIAVAWVEKYGTMGVDIANKHKLASDIMNYHRSKAAQTETGKTAMEQLIAYLDGEISKLTIAAFQSPYKEIKKVAQSLLPTEQAAEQDRALSETQLCLSRLINRVRQSVNKGELVLNAPFQKAFDDGIYIILKYNDPTENLRVVQSQPLPPAPKEA